MEVTKEEIMKQLNKVNEETQGKPLSIKVSVFLTLLALELKEKGLTTKDFYEEKLVL